MKDAIQLLLFVACLSMATPAFAQVDPPYPILPVLEYDAASKAHAASLSSITGAEIPCEDGIAASFPCLNINLLGAMNISALGGAPGTTLNDIWGWTDPQTGREYALVGRSDGTAFVDVTDPLSPVFVGNLPRTTGSRASTWRDVKVYEHYAYIVADGARNHGMQVFDLTQLRSVTSMPTTFTETAHYSGIASAHNIVINEDTGYAYAVGANSGGESCGGGLHMIDLGDPVNPTFAGCFRDRESRRGYSHDAQCVVYNGPDVTYKNHEICFGANEDAISISDVTNKSLPISVSVASYPNAGYVHQGWLTEDHQYFVQNDELDERAFGNNTRTLIWDVSDLDDPVLASEFTGPTPSIDHNLYVRAQYVFQANYTSGLRVLAINDINHPVEVAYFDTYPSHNNAQFSGAWSVYPYFASENLVVTSINEGLFILKPTALIITELASFEAAANGNTALLSWATVSEFNNEGFEVQVRSDGEAYTTHGFVAGHGTTEEPQSYDYQVEGLSAGTHSVRLLQRNMDGSSRLSSEEDVYIIPGTHVLSSLYPNPSPGEVYFSLLLKERQRVIITLYDMQGRRIRTLEDNYLDEQTEHRFTIEGAGLASGTYTVHTIGERFTATQQVTLVR